MNEQVGWRALVRRLKDEAPQYAKLLPELPRLLHHALHARQRDEGPLLAALLREQRRTNRLIQGAMLAALGFVAGAVLAQILLRWPA